MGVPQNIMRALCAVMRPDHFKFASYGPGNYALSPPGNENDVVYSSSEVSEVY